MCVLPLHTQWLQMIWQSTLDTLVITLVRLFSVMNFHNVPFGMTSNWHIRKPRNFEFQVHAAIRPNWKMKQKSDLFASLSLCVCFFLYYYSNHEVILLLNNVLFCCYCHCRFWCDYCSFLCSILIVCCSESHLTNIFL